MKTQNYDLLISYNQIQVRAVAFDENFCQWGEKNIEQGVIINNHYVVFDPLPAGEFGAHISINFGGDFLRDKSTQRCMVVPFEIAEGAKLTVGSASESFDVIIDYNAGKYNLYYEVCEEEEVFYKLTFEKTDSYEPARYLMDDPWGGVKDKMLEIGKK